MENVKDEFESQWLNEPIGRMVRLKKNIHPNILFKANAFLRMKISRIPAYIQLYAGSRRKIKWTRAKGNGRLLKVEDER